ncbi:hypothetical protein ACIA58_23300 [Kribbella sp. NPDC051586]|uniref:hypothetical protein n=1 Tax=Kribbella sp. NPDC051586 TaxID=3364118 RepID=UPI0037948E8D
MRRMNSAVTRPLVAVAAAPAVELELPADMMDQLTNARSSAYADEDRGSRLGELPSSAWAHPVAR